VARTVVVIPTYNERENIQRIEPQILATAGEAGAMPEIGPGDCAVRDDDRVRAHDLVLVATDDERAALAWSEAA
jgi:hypothetical protein